MATFGILYLLLVIFGIVLAVCWIILPFALIGTKPLLRELIAEMRRNNQLLDQRLPALRPPSQSPRDTAPVSRCALIAAAGHPSTKRPS